MFSLIFCPSCATAMTYNNSSIWDQIYRMDQEHQQIPIPGPPNPENSFNLFKTQVESADTKLKGKFILETFPYDPQLIDINTRANWLKRFFTNTFTNFNERPVLYERSFLLYLPPKLEQNMEIIVLLHGTNQTIFDTELVCQVVDLDGVKFSRYGWMELADRQNCVIVIPQSRGLVYRNKKYYGWQPGNQDLNYLFKILEKITSPNYHRQKQLPSFSICRKNISIVGFSNGGLFTSDLYINYISQTGPAQGFSILIFINYMGGIEHELNSMEVLKFDEKMKNTPMVIMSCKKEQNYGPCLRAHQLFEFHECNVCFVEVGHYKHQFIFDAVETVYQFIKGAKINQKQSN